MIGRWWIETLKINKRDVVDKTILPYEDYGLYLVEYDAAPPKPRTYRATIEGRNGTLDLTEWEGPGIIRYDDRTVTVKVREMDGRTLSNQFVGAILGKRVNLHFDDDPEYYYVGRCEEASTSTRNCVTDTSLTFTCQPFRVSSTQKIATFTAPPRVSASTPSITNFTISNSGGIAIPTLTIGGIEDGYATGVYSQLWWSSADVTTYKFYTSDDNGPVATQGVYVRTGQTNFAITNANVSNNITLTVAWRDEVI